jgi:hypothetical protein
MQHLRAVRLLTVMALAVPASVAAWAVSGPASATTGASCSALSGNDSKTTSVVSGCLPTSATGGKGTGVSKTGKGTTGTSTITWATHHGTTKTTFSYSIVPPALEKCGVSSSHIEVKENGKVISSTGPAAKVIKAGQKNTADVCINTKTGAESLRPGTKFLL